MKCKVHPNVELIYHCPACRASVSSEAKAKAAQEDAKKGDRPPGSGTKKPALRIQKNLRAAESLVSSPNDLNGRVFTQGGI